MQGKKLKKRKKSRFGLYQKLAVLVIAVGLVPMTLLTVVLSNQMLDRYYSAMKEQYARGVSYISKSLDNMFESYNTISKLPYYYNSGDEMIRNALSFDNFRQMVSGEKYPAESMENSRETEMLNFLNYIGSIDSNIVASHFVTGIPDETLLDFHESTYYYYFRNEELFLDCMGYPDFDYDNNEMMLIPTHGMGYYGEDSAEAYTVARNYFDIRGEVGSYTYVGTLFIDVNTYSIERIVQTADFSGNEQLYISGDGGRCIYSSDKACIGTDISKTLGELRDSRQQLVITSETETCGVTVTVVLDTGYAFGAIRELQAVMYAVLIAAMVILVCAAFYFSRRLIRPMHEMMEQMAQIETGNFDFEISTHSNDEIGELSERFNQMSRTLKQYINQAYVAKIKRTEAELTALRSQIYPHFLYNTLEIIRMTALEEENKNVPEMIEALSQQIHYLIGPVHDMVPLGDEINIVKKYVYLLNCRIRGKVWLSVQTEPGKKIMVPRLILQPMVENAYVHGIRKKGSGTIQITVETREGTVEIAVMDNGAGMDEERLHAIRELLDGDEPGIKNENDWQSVGMKNVHDRIRFLYGEEYGITITSTVGVGTMVRLCMPLCGGEEEKDSENDHSGR